MVDPNPGKTVPNGHKAIHDIARKHLLYPQALRQHGERQAVAECI
nr:hypothetical protein [Chroococcidiopsis sp. CCALA 051]